MRRALGWAMIFAAAAVALVAVLLAAPSVVHPDASGYRSEAADAGGAFPEIDWEGLRLANPDIIGWVKVPGTNIDAPICQARPDDPERYLQTAYDGSPSRAGCPYLDATCEEKGFGSAMPIVLGHSLLDGSMLTDFKEMSDETYADEHSEIMLMSPEGNRMLEVACVKVVDADVAQKVTGVKDASAAADLLRAEEQDADVVRRPPKQAEQVFLFVTCSYQTGNSRTLVYAVQER